MKLDLDCPHCQKEITIDADKMKVTNGPKEAEAKQQAQILEKPEPEIKEVIKEVVKIPSTIPAYKCKDGNCGKMHPNPNYTKKIVGKCSNCGQFTGDLNSECPFCNKNEYEEIEEDELNDLGIPEPKEAEHDHEGL